MQLSYAESHPKFAKDVGEFRMYPTFYRMVPGDATGECFGHLCLKTNPYLLGHRARAHFIRQLNWTRIGTVKQSDLAVYALVVIRMIMANTERSLCSHMRRSWRS